MKRNRRPAFSLIEVILALAILLASLIVLGQMVVVGQRHARDAEWLSTAEAICQTRLDEILIGARPLEPAAAEPVPEVPGWVCSVEVEPHGRFGLVTLRVTASRQAPEGAASSAAESAGKRFVLTRWMHAPTATGSVGLPSPWQEAASPDSLFDEAILP